MGANKLNLKQPKGRELLGGDLLAQCLQQLGVDVIFGLHGGHLDAFLMGCTDIGIKLVDTRHETVAVQAAEGYAKVAGKTGVCFVTANSGFCNGLPGLATAFADRSPVLCITSSPPLRDAETNCLQGFHDQVVLAKPMTKLAHRLTNVGEIPRIVSLAWRTASSGTPGPVVLDFPIDVLFTPVEQDDIAWGNIMGGITSRPGPDPAAIKEVAGLLKSAQRPLVIVGTGASSAVTELETLSNNLHLPIFHSAKFSTGISNKHPYRAGVASTLALLSVLKKPQPDLVLLLGARTGFLLGGRDVVSSTPDCKVVQIDIDGSEIGRSTLVSLGLVSDIQLALSALNAELDSSSSKFTVAEEWVKTALSLQAFRAPHTEAQPKIDETNGHLHPYHGVKALFNAVPDGSIFSIDGGECGSWSLQLLPEANASLTLFSCGYLGFLGNGFGYSLGAAIADPSRVVVNLQGDGSAGFHIAELDTYAKFGCKVLTVVINNSAWGMSQAGQSIIFGHATDAKPAACLRPETRFDLIAKGFGMPGFIIDATSLPDVSNGEQWTAATETLKKAVDEIVKSNGPGMIDLRVSPLPWHDGTVAMVGAAADQDPDTIVVPYYDNLPRPYFKKKKENGHA